MLRASVPLDPWSALFPVNEAQRATQFLVETWRTVTALSPHQFAPNLREHELTEKFWVYLDRLSISVGKLMGQWSYEVHQLEFDVVSEKTIKRLRQDIQYFSNAGEGRLSLTYEFKKLKARTGSWRIYQGKDGMRRFVDGYYAKQQPVAAMVAMTLDDPKRCIDGLRRYLLIDQNRDNLQMLPDHEGRYIRDPSVVFSGVAAFDTEHKRPPDQAPPQGATILAHIFLQLPPD